MDLVTARFNMVHQQVRPVGVSDPKILDLLETIPRERFVPKEFQSLSYSDTSIPIGLEQVMLPPKIVGRLLQALQLKPTDTVLEIGTGTGYVTCLLAQLTKRVTSIEIFPELSQTGEALLKTFKLHNIQLKVGNGINGYLEASPFDAIVFTGSLPLLPPKLREQLSVQGRIFAILGQSPVMKATLLTRIKKNEWTEESLFETVVPCLIDAPQPEEFKF